LKNNKQLMFLNLILLQLFLSCFVAWSYIHLWAFGWKASSMLIFGVVVLIGVLCIWTVREILQLVKKEHEAEISATRLEESKALVKTLKARQHDFVNHLQVIYGLVYLGKEDKLKEYIRNLSADLYMIDKLAALQSPELAALISKKMTVSDTVKLDIEIGTDLAHLQIPGDRMVSILGNLLDNAIQEQEKHSSPQKVSLKIYEEDREYIFEIHNDGFIPPELQEQIFEPGFTTKAEKGGSGMGLPIVKKLVPECGGILGFVSNEAEGTTFSVKFPFHLAGKDEKTKKEVCGELNTNGNKGYRTNV
jgi:two-component system sensor histidine kinase AgrC